MTKKTKIIIGVVFALIMLANVAGYIAGVQKQKAKDAEITRLATENQNFYTVNVGNNEIIARQEQRIVDLQSAEKALLIDIKALKALGVKDAQVIINLTTENKRLKLEATYTKPPEVIHDTIVVNGIPSVRDYLRVPLAWKYADKWSGIYGTVKTTGVTIDSSYTYSQPQLILGYSTGFLKKSKPIVVYKDLNPSVRVIDMSNIVIPQKPKFFQRPWVNKVEGALIVVAGAWGINQFR